MSRRAARVDANQGEIVKALRALGFSVFDASSLGGGFPDIVVGKRGVNHLMEIKDGNKPPSARNLTPKEAQFFNLWQGEATVINSLEEALKVLHAQ